jgi:hypothetical protein
VVLIDLNIPVSLIVSRNIKNPSAPISQFFLLLYKYDAPIVEFERNLFARSPPGNWYEYDSETIDVRIMESFIFP